MPWPFAAAPRCAAPPGTGVLATQQDLAAQKQEIADRVALTVGEIDASHERSRWELVRRDPAPEGGRLDGHQLATSCATDPGWGYPASMEWHADTRRLPEDRQWRGWRRLARASPGECRPHRDLCAIDPGI